MVVSDHGMVSGSPQSGVEYVEIDDYLDMDDVSYVIDRAALAAVAPLPGKTDKVNEFHHRRPTDYTLSHWAILTDWCSNVSLMSFFFSRNTKSSIQISDHDILPKFLYTGIQAAKANAWYGCLPP